MKNSKKLATKFLFTFIFWLFSNSFYGFVVVDLYNIYTPAEQSEKSIDKKVLLEQGFKQLLMKLSGNNDFDDNAIIQSALKDPKLFLQEYTFVKNSDNTRELKQVYNKMAVDSLMQQANLPTWGISRPLVMVLLVVEQEFGERALLSESEDNKSFLGQIKSQVDDVASVRAMPLAWPMYDLDERQSLSIKNLWAFDKSEAETLATKYRPDELIIGKIYLDRDSWNIKWHHKGDVYHKESSESSLLDDLKLSFNEITNKIAKEYSFIPSKEKSESQGEEESFEFHVNKINTLNKFTNMTDYLKSIKTVSSYLISKIDGDTVTLKVNLKTGKNLFLREIKLESKFVNISDDSSSISCRWS